MIFSRTYASIALAACLIAIAVPFATRSQGTPLSDADKAQLQAFGVDPNILGGRELLTRLYGGCEFNPYPILEKYRSGQVNITPVAGTGSTNDFQRGINPELACRLVKFFQYAETQGCTNIKVISGYRSAQQQADMCGSGRTGCAPAGRSCHQYGLAIDVGSSCTKWMRSFLGTKNPGSPGARQFGLHFPYSGDHIQCIENNVASCSPNTQQCAGKFRIAADLNVASAPPTRSVANALRDFLNPQPQAQMPRPQLPMQQLSQPQSPLNAFNPTPNPNTNTNTNTSGQINVSGSTQSASGTPSAADQLAELAFGNEKTDESVTVSATSVPVYVSGSDASVLAGIHQDTVASTTEYYVPTFTAEQTFTSDDLGWESNLSSQVGTLSALAQMRATLEWLTAYLKPFGRPPGPDGEDPLHAE